MPFFSFLGCKSNPLDGSRQRGSSTKFEAKAALPYASVALAGKGKSPSVARCSEKSSAFSRVPSLGFFGSAPQASSGGGDDAAVAERHEKARADAMAREDEQPTQPAKKIQ